MIAREVTKSNNLPYICSASKVIEVPINERHIIVTHMKQMKRTPTLNDGVLFVKPPPYSLNCEKTFTSLCCFRTSATFMQTEYLS